MQRALTCQWRFDRLELSDRADLQGQTVVPLHSMIPHQELAMAGALDNLRQATACSPGSLAVQQHALQGIALARGRHMSEVYDLKQKNLQVWRPSSADFTMLTARAIQEPAGVICKNLRNKMLQAAASRHV